MSEKACHTVYLLTGSNLGDKLRFLEIAEQSLCRSLGRLIAKSSVYESEAWGFVAEETFVNQVLQFETGLTPFEILEIIHEIENANGRTRSYKGYSSRTLDIDILFYDDLIIDLPDLQIPHPRLHLRKFTLEPLCEIAPKLLHPILKKTVEQLLEQIQTQPSIKKNITLKQQKFLTS